MILKIDEREEWINFKAVDAISQEMLVETEFCLAFGLQASLLQGRWRTKDGTWYRYNNQEGKDPTTTIKGTIVTRREGEREKETVVEGVRDWVCGLGKESGRHGDGRENQVQGGDG